MLFPMAKPIDWVFPNEWWKNLMIETKNNKSCLNNAEGYWEYKFIYMYKVLYFLLTNP